MRHGAATPINRDRSCRHVRADGGEIEVLTFGRKVAYHGHDAQLVAIVDITERKRAEAEVAYLAHHDALTGLRNRAYFRHHLGASIDAVPAQESCSPSAASTSICSRKSTTPSAIPPAIACCEWSRSGCGPP